MKTTVRSCVIKLYEQKSFRFIFKNNNAVNGMDIMRQLIPLTYKYATLGLLSVKDAETFQEMSECQLSMLNYENKRVTALLTTAETACLQPRSIVLLYFCRQSTRQLL